MTQVERDMLRELRLGPFGLRPDEIEGYASGAHGAYRARGVPLAWVHPAQLARALGLVILRDPVAPCAMLQGNLIRLPPEGSERADRSRALHEIAEHLLVKRADATHADVHATALALSIERADVALAVKLYGRSGAVRVLAAVHRRVPWWEIRARIALADACARW